MFVYLINKLQEELNTFAENSDIQGLKDGTRMLRRIKAVFVCKCFLDALIIIFAITFYEPASLFLVSIRTVGTDIIQLARLKWGIFKIDFGMALCFYLGKILFGGCSVLILAIADSSIPFGYTLIFLLVIIIRTIGVDFVKMIFVLIFFMSDGFKRF